VRIVDLRPVEFKSFLDVLSADKYPLKATISLRYRISNAEKAIVKAPEDLRGQIDWLLKSEAGKQVCKNMTMDQVLANRDELGKDIQRFLNEHSGDWGIDIETAQVQELHPPTEVPHLQRELYEMTMRNIIEPLRAEIQAKTLTIGAEAEAKAYAMKAEAKLNAFDRYIEIVSEAAEKIAEKYGAKEARDIMFVLFGDGIGYDNPVGQKIRTKLTAEGVGEGATAVAKEIEADPKFTYLMTALQNIRGGILGITSFRDLKDLDKQLTDKLYRK
jgi:regulator of protease activity HflC (stomatin/prohibitin superfamily)